MPHLLARYIKTAGVEGELGIDDYGVFLAGGALHHVSEFWEATVAQALILDVAHAKAIDDASKSAARFESDVEHVALSEKLQRTLRRSDTYLVKANIFCLLMAFFEYAMLELYLLVFSEAPRVDRPQLNEHIIRPLQGRGIVGEPPTNYKKHVVDNRDAIRNALAHGRWNSLKEATDSLDLYESFKSIIDYCASVEATLREKGYNP